MESPSRYHNQVQNISFNINKYGIDRFSEKDIATGNQQFCHRIGNLEVKCMI
jgi:hypothetical protein